MWCTAGYSRLQFPHGPELNTDNLSPYSDPPPRTVDPAVAPTPLSGRQGGDAATQPGDGSGRVHHGQPLIHLRRWHSEEAQLNASTFTFLHLCIHSLAPVCVAAEKKTKLLPKTKRHQGLLEELGRRWTSTDIFSTVGIFVRVN